MGLNIWYIIGIILVCVLCTCIGGAISGFYIGHKYCVQLINIRKLSNKHLQIIEVYDLWMSLPQNAIENFLKKKNVGEIAIYGFSYLGKRLYQKLKESDIKIAYALDINPKVKIDGLSIIKPDEMQGDIKNETVIVTAIFDFDAIKTKLENMGYTNIISLYELLYDIVIMETSYEKSTIN